MDPLTQGVLGAALPQAGSSGRYAASAGLLGFLAGMAADLDVLIRSTTDPLLFLEYPAVHTLPGIYSPGRPDLRTAPALRYWSQAGFVVSPELVVLHAGLCHPRIVGRLHQLRHDAVLAV